MRCRAAGKPTKCRYFHSPVSWRGREAKRRGAAASAPGAAGCHAAALPGCERNHIYHIRMNKLPPDHLLVLPFGDSRSQNCYKVWARVNALDSNIFQIQPNNHWEILPTPDYSQELCMPIEMSLAVDAKRPIGLDVQQFQFYWHVQREMLANTLKHAKRFRIANL